MGQIAQQLLALNSAKHAIRQAINEKIAKPLDKAAPLSLYPQAIRDIPSGDLTVIYIDWDGTILKEEQVRFGGRSIPPDAPNHNYLTFKGWTQGEAVLSRISHSMIIGALYEESPECVLILYGVEANEELSLSLRPQNTVQNAWCEIDWGDGITTNKNVLISGEVAKHTYANPGDYTVIIRATEGVPIAIANAPDFVSTHFYKVFFGRSASLFDMSFQNNTVAEKCIGLGAKYGVEISGGYVFNNFRHSSIKGFVQNTPVAQGQTSVPSFGCWFMFAPLGKNYVTPVAGGSSTGARRCIKFWELFPDTQVSSSNATNLECEELYIAGVLHYRQYPKVNKRVVYASGVYNANSITFLNVSGIEVVFDGDVTFEISSNLTIYFGYQPYWLDVFKHFADTTVARTITITGASRPSYDTFVMDEIKKILIPKGYTVAFN